MDIVFPLEEIGQAAKDFLKAIGEKRVIAFYGKMGVGKTTFVKALCDELGVGENVTSPTFAIMNEYTNGKTGEPIFHFDFYRIKKVDEVYDIGYEDYVDSGYLCLIEWPELIENLLPEDCLKVFIEETATGHRRISGL